MTGPSDQLRQPFDCREVDALDAAFVLGAVETDEARAVLDHLATCPQPHAGLRGLVGIEQVLAMSLEPVAPSPTLRERLMATIRETPQEHAAPVTQVREATPATEPQVLKRYCVHTR